MTQRKNIKESKVDSRQNKGVHIMYMSQRESKIDKRTTQVGKSRSKVTHTT